MTPMKPYAMLHVHPESLDEPKRGAHVLSRSWEALEGHVRRFEDEDAPDVYAAIMIAVPLSDVRRVKDSINAMMQEGTRESERIDATVKTFLYVASLMWASGDEKMAEALRGVVENILLGSDSWLCCPVCEESECDSDCPLEPLRRGLI